MDTQEAYDDVLARAERLSFEEIQRLVNDLNARLEQHKEQESEPHHKARDFRGVGKDAENIQPHSITELRGVGKELWQGIDVEKYIEEERSSWDR